MKVFLGGTVADSTWRDELIPMLEIDFFNPVVDDWNEEAHALELRERASADWVLYVLTPKMIGTFSVAEVVDDSNKRPEKTLLLVLERDDGKAFGEHERKALGHVEEMVERNGGRRFETLASVAAFLNEQGRRHERLEEHRANIKEASGFDPMQTIMQQSRQR